jgi:hypothetical protein
MYAEAVVTLLARRETKVCNLQLIFLVKKQILWLEVPVHYARRIMQILNRAEELEEIVPSKALIEAALLVADLNEREEIALLHELQDDEKDLDSLPTGLNDYLSFAVVLDELYYIWVVHCLNEVYFILEDLLERLQIQLLHLMSFYDLYRIKSTILKRFR